MPGLAVASNLDQLPSEIVSWLVGHTVRDVERKLILHTLASLGGSRTRASNALGISIRTLRNKISEYEASGIAVPVPGVNTDMHRNPTC